MVLKELDILKNLWRALKLFFQEDGFDKCSILAYYSIFSSLFLLTFFAFLFTKSLGDPDIVFKGIYPLSSDFFTKISPDILKRAAEISNKMEEIGVFGITASLFLGFLVIIKIVQYVNAMFHINLKAKKSEKGFWIRRISEIGLLVVIGLLMMVSFIITGIISGVTAVFQENEFLASHINPQFIQFINTILLKYALPFLITFVFFFTLYKWIPEKVVYIKGAFIAAIITTLLWETLKRAFTFYMIKISIFGKIQGPIIAVILFGFWMELSMGIMLYGAKLTFLFDKEKEKHDQPEPARNITKDRRRTKG
jgi:membrane protein